MFKRTLLAATLAASGAAATTLSHDEAERGDISNAWAAPTEIGAGHEWIRGTGSARSDSEYLLLGGLGAGAQTLSLGFAALRGADRTYSAVGKVFWSEEPFGRLYAAELPHEKVKVSFREPYQSMDLELGPDFAGRLFLAFDFLNGNEVGWNIHAPGNGATVPAAAGGYGPAPAVIPLPGALWLGMGGLGALALLALRRARA